MLGAVPMLGACGQNTPDLETSAATAVPAATSAPRNTMTVWYYDGAIGQTVEAFKRANPTIDIDLKTFGDAAARQGVEQKLMKANPGLTA
jgi:hypothetical protein